MIYKTIVDPSRYVPQDSSQTDVLYPASRVLSDGATGTGTIVHSQSPTIVTPTIASFTNAQHNHQNAAGGGALDAAAIASGTLPVARGGTGNTTGTATVNANLTGPITSVGNATAVASQTGTGTTFVMSASPQLTGTLGIGGAPGANDVLYATQNVNALSDITIENPNAGTGAQTAMIVKSDAAIVNFRTHASARTAARFGVTLGGWSELLTTAGNGLIAGTFGAVPLILGTSAQAREAFDGVAKALTEGAATGVVDISLANNTVVGGELRFTIEANDGTDYQARRGRIPFVAVSKAGTLTITLGTLVEDVAVSAGTLTVAVTSTAGAAKFTINLNATSSLAQTTLRVSRSVVIDGGTAGVTFL